jgi:hypothetical protein
MRLTPSVLVLFALLHCSSAEIEIGEIEGNVKTEAVAQAFAQVHNALYSDIRPANLSDSLRRIKSTEFVNYRFQYDSVAERVQMEKEWRKSKL